MSDVYVVKSGDTLGAIAQQNDTTVAKLMGLNSSTISNPNQIYVGQNIIVPSTLDNVLSVLKKKVQAMIENALNAKPGDDGMDKCPKNIKHINVIVVGAEDHDLSLGNKLMFTMNAVRRARLTIGSFDETKVYFFRGKKEEKGKAFLNYTKGHIDAFKKSLVKLGLIKSNLIEVNSWIDLSSKLNSYCNDEIKIKRMDFYGHGSNRGFWFSHDEDIFLTKSNVASLKPIVFKKDAKVYFYGCQIGNGFINMPQYFEWLGNAGVHRMDLSRKKEYIEINKKHSLAQAVADSWEVDVNAPMNRTQYFRTTMSKEKGDMPVETIDHAFWNEDGSNWDISTIESSKNKDKNMDGDISIKERIKFYKDEVNLCNYQNFKYPMKVCQDFELTKSNIFCRGVCFPSGFHWFKPRKGDN